MHSDILRSLRDVVRRNPPLKKLGINIWFVLYDDVSALQSVLVKDSLAKKDVTARENLPYSFDLASGDSYLFFLLKSA